MSGIWLLAGFFVFVLAAVTGAGYLVLNRRQQANTAVPEGVPAVLRESPEGGSVLASLFHAVGDTVVRSSKDTNPIRRQLIQAGYRLPSAVGIFYGIKCASTLLFGLIALWAAISMDSNVLLGALPAAAFGYMIPDRVLGRAISRRAARLRHALPAALDVLVLAVEAGQSLDQALIAASRGLKATYPDLSAELTMLHLEARASNNRVEALRNFASRNKEPELKKFASLIVDTDRFGTSVGPALRDHAKYLRIRFRQQAQESARKVGVKLIFPVFFLIFPSVVLVTLGPAVIMILTQLKGMLGR